MHQTYTKKRAGKRSRTQLSAVVLASLFAAGAVANAQGMNEAADTVSDTVTTTAQDAAVDTEGAAQTAIDQAENTTAQSVNEAVDAAPEPPAVTAPVVPEPAVEVAPPVVTAPVVTAPVVTAPAVTAPAVTPSSTPAMPSGAAQPTEEPRDLSGILADPESGPVMEGLGEGEDLTYSVESQSEFHSSNNSDFRSLDDTSTEDVILTDDNYTFGYTSVVGTIAYSPEEDVQFNVSLAHAGLWGSDQLGYESRETGVLRFYALNTVYRPQLGDLDLSLAVGRQRFEIGVVPTDYMLSDTLDSVVLGLSQGPLNLRVLALDIYGANHVPDQAFTNYVGGRDSIIGFDGDTNTLRHGAVLDVSRELNETLLVDAAAYYFYATIGAGRSGNSGADISEGGSNGNFSDNDYLSMAGGRISATVGLDIASVQLYGDVSSSSGIDRQGDYTRDIATDGSAFGGGIVADVSTAMVDVTIAADYYHFDGGTYGSDGIQSNHGFVSFKGAHAGGLALNNYLGWSPSATLDARGGVQDTPHDNGGARSQRGGRSSGSDMLHAELGLGLNNGLAFRVEYWGLSDTNLSFISSEDYASGNCNELYAPFGTNSESFCAQQRFGEDLVSEIDLTLSYSPNDTIELFGTYATAAPGAFYDFTTGRVVGSGYEANTSFSGFAFALNTTF